MFLVPDRLRKWYDDPNNIVPGNVNLADTVSTAITGLTAHGNAKMQWYILWLCVTNIEATLRDVDILGGATLLFQAGAAASGGGFCSGMPFVPVGANAALNARNNTAGGSPSINVSAVCLLAPVDP